MEVKNTYTHREFGFLKVSAKRILQGALKAEEARVIVSNKNCGARGRCLHRANWRYELTASWGITERIVEKPGRVITLAKLSPE